MNASMGPEAAMYVFIPRTSDMLSAWCDPTVDTAVDDAQAVTTSRSLSIGLGTRGNMLRTYT
jgi:hypothetical protein